MFNHVKSVACVFSLLHKSFCFCSFRQVGIAGRCFLHIYSLALKTRSCFIELRSKFNVRIFGSISKLDFVLCFLFLKLKFNLQKLMS